MRELLFPMRWLYQGATLMRNWAYDHKILSVAQVDAKVIAIGNLTVGGTGKTPVALALIEMLKKRGHSVAVISRGYKREQKGVLEVDTSAGAANTYGDEPALIKRTHPEMKVVVGARRKAAAQAVLESGKVDFIVCDDAFQHRALHRDLNLLLFDASESVPSAGSMPVSRIARSGGGRASVLGGERGQKTAGGPRAGRGRGRPTPSSPGLTPPRPRPAPAGMPPGR